MSQLAIEKKVSLFTFSLADEIHPPQEENIDDPDEVVIGDVGVLISSFFGDSSGVFGFSFCVVVSVFSIFHQFNSLFIKFFTQQRLIKL
jgi:hypothetical protein